jgi:galactokinase
VEQTYCRRRDGSIFPEPADGFKLWQRYKHVVEEGRRVEESLKVLRDGHIASVGILMNQSHTSCRDLYEISCPELDLLVEISREAGALGARLTGAGFGGCSISLVKEDRVESFMAEVVERYYRSARRCREEEIGSAIFPCQAVTGAGVMEAIPARPPASAS